MSNTNATAAAPAPAGQPAVAAQPRQAAAGSGGKRHRPGSAQDALFWLSGIEAILFAAMILALDAHVSWLFPIRFGTTSGDVSASTSATFFLPLAWAIFHAVVQQADSAFRTELSLLIKGELWWVFLTSIAPVTAAIIGFLFLGSWGTGWWINVKMVIFLTALLASVNDAPSTWAALREITGRK